MAYEKALSLISGGGGAFTAIAGTTLFADAVDAMKSGKIVNITWPYDPEDYSVASIGMFMPADESYILAQSMNSNGMTTNIKFVADENGIITEYSGD